MLLTLLATLSTLTPLFVGVTFLWSYPPRPVGVANLATWALACAVMLLPVALLSRWDFFGIYAQWATVALLVAAVGVRWYTAGAVVGRAWPDLKVAAVSVACAALGGALFFVLTRPPADAPLALQMPLEGSRWHVAHGGGNFLTNQHASVPAQRYALDLTVVGVDGRRAASLQPTALADYLAWGQPVTAPCDGLVQSAEDGHADQPIGQTDAAHPAGNHVVIGCEGAAVVLAHLQRGSVAVKPGSSVRAGQLLGRVGNSGNTSEPHLHVHAVRGEPAGADELLFTGKPVPLTFAGRFLLRGDAPATGH